jgi:hypothetical protein
MTHSQEGFPFILPERKSTFKAFWSLGFGPPLLYYGYDHLPDGINSPFQEWWSWSAVLRVNANVGQLSIFRPILRISIKHILFLKQGLVFLINQFITRSSCTFIFIKKSLSFVNMSIFNFQNMTNKDYAYQISNFLALKKTLQE